MKTFVLIVAVALTVLTILVGCAGFGESTRPASTAALAVRIVWPKPDTRLIPLAAKSINVVVTLNGTAVKSVVIARPTIGQNITTTTLTGLPPTDVVLTATASPNADGSGTIQASGSTHVTLQSGVTVASSLTMQSTISYVVITPATISLTKGDSLHLVAAAFDVANNLVLTSSTWTWSSTGTGITLTTSGANCTVSATGSGSGTISVKETESNRSLSHPFSTTSTVTYTSFQGAALTLNPWLGQHVAILTTDPNLDPVVMGKLTTTFDAVYSYYQSVTGQTPSLYKNVGGRTTIAEVMDTCGAGCSAIGGTGIEIQPPYFDLLYSQVRDTNQYDQVVFYEFGRNFWFYSPKIEYKGSDNLGTITTGFAVLMRFESMEAVGVQGAPFHGSSTVPFATLRSEVEGLVDKYEADPTLNWSNTLKIGKAPTNSLGLGGTDLFASMCMRLARDHGGQSFITKLWKAVGNRPDAGTTNESLLNFERAASSAAGVDLTLQFRTAWKWPI